MRACSFPSFIFIIAALCFTPSMVLAQSSTTWEKLRQRNLVPGKEYQVSSGTGFFVNDFEVVTNAHVVEGCLNISIRGAVPPSSARLIAVDKKNDLALLKTKTLSPSLASLRLNDGIKTGDDVSIIGYPLGAAEKGKYVFEKARIIKMDTPSLANARRIEFTDSIKHGNSGGPLIDSGGNVIGVIVAKAKYTVKIRQGQTLRTRKEVTGIAIGLATLKEFLKQSRVRWLNRSTHDIFSEYRPDQRAKHYIVNIHCVYDG